MLCGGHRSTSLGHSVLTCKRSTIPASKGHGRTDYSASRCLARGRSVLVFTSHHHPLSQPSLGSMHSL